jgi:hypothetical protein
MQPTPSSIPLWAWYRRHPRPNRAGRDAGGVQTNKNGEQPSAAPCGDVVTVRELKTVLFECLLDESTKQQTREAFCCVDIDSNCAAVDLCKFFKTGIDNLKGNDVRLDVANLQRCVERCYDKGSDVLKTEYGRMCDAFLQVALSADDGEDDEEYQDDGKTRRRSRRESDESPTSASSSSDDSPSPAIRDRMSKLAHNSNALAALCFFLSINRKLLCRGEEEENEQQQEERRQPGGAKADRIRGREGSLQRRPNLFAVIVECLAEKYHPIVNATT